ncbi:hypothetical protein H2248_002800 [Termitomyces sp. 'cryptogamus']|nr:hypothetical protein H2248_002800 [Termitomyces sp. 'cryptogamus']
MLCLSTDNYNATHESSILKFFIQRHRTHVAYTRKPSRKTKVNQRHQVLSNIAIVTPNDLLQALDLCYPVYQLSRQLHCVVSLCTKNVLQVRSLESQNRRTRYPDTVIL